MNLFNKKSDNNPQDLTTISRTQIIDGLSVPAIIKNESYCFTDLQVFSDGLIYCWEMVDLPLFKKKLNENRVVTSIPDGKKISIHALGDWKIEKGEWFYKKDSYYQYVFSLVKQLNPRLENLHDCHNRTTEKRGNASVYILGIPNSKSYYIPNPKTLFPERTRGQSFPIFFKNDDNKIYLSEISIFEDGKVEITRLTQKKIYNFSDIRVLIENQQLLSIIPFGERITILGLGSFIVKEGTGINIESKYNEFLDSYNVMLGKESSIKKCKRICDDYINAPSEELRSQLKEAYEAVPEHLRMYVGDMDSKDNDVRWYIYGNHLKK